MEKSAMLEAMDSWPVQERLDFIGEAWDRLTASGCVPEPDAKLWAEIERRRAEHAADPNSALSREQFEARLRRP
ncbi:MAG TPA: addiction module protein [Gemmataceae bacterium]|nr:addiction module protein [Gemmataceae bacterium]